MEGYKNNARSYALPVIVMSAAFAVFVATYNKTETRANPNKENTDRPTIEAILNKEEKLFEIIIPERLPRDRNNLDGMNGYNSFNNSYTGKRNV